VVTRSYWRPERQWRRIGVADRQIATAILSVGSEAQRALQPEYARGTFDSPGNVGAGPPDLTLRH